MKKIYQSSKFKRIQKTKILKRKRKRRKRKLMFESSNLANPKSKSASKTDKFAIEIVAPEDLRLMSNTNECVNFINRLQDSRNYGKQGSYKFLRVSFKSVSQIDYSMISVLIAIVGETKNKGILTHINTQIDFNVRKYMMESGLFKDFYDSNGKKLPKYTTESHIFFEKGTGKLTREEMIKMADMVKNIHKHILGRDGFCLRLNTILKEICGNSIEWSGPKEQWLLGFKYEKETVLVSITDLGNGILKTLNSKYGDILIKLRNRDVDILIGAFEKRYGSKSLDVNRNKGLPCVRISNEEGKISNLKVLTNNVKIDFQDKSNNEVLDVHTSFTGTQYIFEITKANLITL